MGLRCVSSMVAVRGASRAEQRTWRVRLPYLHQSIRATNISCGRFCQNIGWLYIRLVAHNTLAAKVDSDEDQETPTEESPLIMGVHHEKQHSIHEFMAMYCFRPHSFWRVYSSVHDRELHLQIQLIKLQELLAQTQHEPRLKGPFPVKLYRGILTGLQTILDRLHSMRCVTMRDEW
jgi:hypothetical protein